MGAGNSLDREVPDLVKALPHPALEWGEDAIIIFLVGLNEDLEVGDGCVMSSGGTTGSGI